MVEKQLKYALLTKYKKLCQSNNIDCNLNIHVEQWAAKALVDSYGLEMCYQLLDYYFRISETPSWKWFTNNADKLYKNLQAKKEDDRIREELRKQAKEWLK